MSNNIFSSNDDYLFEDYNDSEETSFKQEDEIASQENFDKAFSEMDSSFRNLLDSSSLKVNFGDSFYNAAYDWMHQGYREANSIAVVDALAEITQGKFLYQHRLITSVELLNRKKTIIKFLDAILNDELEESVIKIAGKTSKEIRLSKTYFDMFFRSFYNIQIHTYYCELAVYMSICDILGVEHDPSLTDPRDDSSIVVTELSDHINKLYINYFDKENMTEKIEAYINDFFTHKDSI